MPLEPPQLDDRQFEDLLAEAKLRLQRYCPEWTDFNDSDPGMALVQLFAWLTELMLYRINQIPERSYIQFLKKLNLERHAARPARTQVVMTTIADGSPKLQSVRARSKFQVPSPGGESLTFETIDPLDLIPYPLDGVQVFDGLNYEDYSDSNTSGSKTFRPLGWTPQIENALYLGFHPSSADVKKEGLFPRRMSLHFFFPSSQLTPVVSGDPNPSGQRLPKLVWEYQSRLDRTSPDTQFDPDRWRPLTVIEDQTGSLTQEGRVILRGPDTDCLATTSPKPVDDELRFWIRCRLVEGKYSTEMIPEITFVRCNVVEVENRATFQNEVVAVGDGTQTSFQLQNHPVDPASLVLVVLRDGDDTPEPCIQKEDLYESSVNDLDYTLNGNSGEIRFGDGRRGRIPGVGERVVALSYRAGGGAAGNIEAGAIKDPPLGTVPLDSVINPRPATGGTDEESLNSLLERAPRVLRGDARAVTKDDYRRFAEEIPGVGRAIVLPQYLQSHRGLKIPGAVTVVVIPATPRDPVAGEVGEPRFEPTQDLLKAVARRLDDCRPVGTEVEVVAPRLHSLDLWVEVSPAAGISDVLAQQLSKRALEHYFRPVEEPQLLPAIDPETNQRRKPPAPRWELGSPIYPSRLYEVLLSARDEANGTPAVENVSALKLKKDGVPVEVGTSFTLDPDELPYPSITIQIAPPTTRRRP